MIKRLAIRDIWIENCKQYDEYNGIVDKAVNKKLKELGISHNGIVSIQEDNINEMSINIVIYYKEI